MATKLHRITKLGERGQLSIPKNARVAFNLNPQDKIFIVRRKNGYGKNVVLLVNAKQMEKIVQNNLDGIKQYGPTVMETNGQIIVPKLARDNLNLFPGRKYIIASHFFKKANSNFLFMVDARLLEMIAEEFLTLLSQEDEYDNEAILNNFQKILNGFADPKFDLEEIKGDQKLD